MRLSAQLTVACAVLLLSACERAPRELTAGDVAAIKAQYSKWAAAIVGGDFKTAAGILAEDYWSSWPNAAPVHGRDALIAILKANPRPVALTFSVDEVGGRGDHAFARVSATETFRARDGSTTVEHFSTLNILRRRSDGTWEFARDAGHVTDAMPPTPVPGALAAQEAPASVVSEFQALENAWARATQTKDTRALESILADEYYGFEVGFGQPESKRDLIASTKASTVKWSTVTNTVRDVRLFGEMAVVRGEWAGIGTVDGRPLNARDSWMNVFIRRNGRWVSVASHDAPFPVPSKQ